MSRVGSRTYRRGLRGNVRGVDSGGVTVGDDGGVVMVVHSRRNYGVVLLELRVGGICEGVSSVVGTARYDV